MGDERICTLLRRRGRGGFLFIEFFISGVVESLLAGWWFYCACTVAALAIRCPGFRRAVWFMSCFIMVGLVDSLRLLIHYTCGYRLFAIVHSASK